MQESHITLQYMLHYNESIFVAECSMKRAEQFNTTFIYSLLKKPQRSLSTIRITVVCFIHIRVEEGESGHLNICISSVLAFAMF